MTEIRAALSRLRRSPGFALGATLSLALGMSLATAVYSVVAGARRPLPFLDPDRLVYMSERGTRGEFKSGSRVPARHLVALRAEASSFAAVAAYREYYTLLGESGAARSVTGRSVTSNLFSTLGVQPMIGRTFTEADRGAKVVVLSHTLWTSEFGSVPDIVGKAVRINAEPFTVIGVMGPQFDFPRGARLWYLMADADIRAEAASANEDNDWPKYLTVARLAPGVTLERAAGEAGLLYSRLYGDHFERRFMTTDVRLLSDWLNAGIGATLALWIAAAAMILGLCAVNFASMSLSRGMRRRGETAVRAALGASRWALVRANLIEAGIIAAVSGALATLFAGWLISFARIWFANGALPIEPEFNWTTLTFGVVATLIVGFVFALAPALELAAVDLRNILAGDAAASTSRKGEMRGRRALVTTQLAFALTAVAVVAALVNADRRWQAYDVGLEYDQLVLGDLHGPPRQGAIFASNALNQDTNHAWVAPGPVLERLSNTPGVSGVSVITSYRRATTFFPDGEIDKVYWGEMHVTPNLFQVLGVNLLAGRLPNEDERRAGNTWVVTEHFALRYALSIQDAIGLKVRVQRGVRRPKETVTITGVAPAYGGSGLWNLSSSLFVFEEPAPSRFATIVMRVQDDPQVHANRMARNLAGLDARLMVTNVATAKSLVDAAQGATRGRKIFLGAVAALALTLAMIGVYSLTSYNTDLRLREFGIRMALGATTPSLARAVFGDLWWMSAIGIVVGVFASGRAVDFLDSAYRNPMMSGRLIILPVMPTIACAVTLVIISIVGTAMPLRRVLKMDVMRTVQGST